ncbi:FAD binding domain-containing protein [Sporodiniella umbellata]|nr:FAD binding domain-containing protein [Sporodiniella umbellata]
MSKTVVVIGGGLAGLTAAIEAHESNVKVVLIEKESKIGGNSIKASSGINAMVSEEDRDLFIQDTLKSGGGESEELLVHKLVDESQSALDWLMRQGELDLSLVSQCGGHSVARTHRCPSENGRPVPVGWKLIETLKRRLGDLPNVDILTQTRVLELITKDERVCGVRVKDSQGEREIESEAVILTSGGFGGQTSKQMESGESTLLSQFAPQLIDIATTNGPWANGDGIRLGLSVNASTRNMERVQLHPTGFVDPSNPTASTKFLAPESLRAYGAILLNGQGERFANELGLRQYVTEQVFAQIDKAHSRAHSWMSQKLPKDYPSAYLVLTEETVENFGRSTLGFYASKGFFVQTKGISGLAKILDIEDESDIEKMFEEYDKRQDQFGKSIFPCKYKSQDIYWVALVTPVVHYTMGGLEMNVNSSILTVQGEAIKGLYGAGEVTGGVHGRNRLAGNSLLECIVYGRTAGSQAALYAQSL